MIDVDYANVRVNEDRSRRIAALYMSAPAYDDSELVTDAYKAFAVQVREQFVTLLSVECITVLIQDENPYDSADEMFADVRNNHTLRVLSTDSTGAHPYLSNHLNDMFRAVHDYYGHYLSARGFDRHGEEAAFIRHSQMFSGLARRAMTTETRGQNSAFIFALGGEVFPEQKLTLLPLWVTEDV